MRFLLSLILSAVLFTSPLRGSAGEPSGKQVAGSIKKSTSATNFLHYSATDGEAIAIIHFNQRTGSTSHYRFFPFTAFINTAGIQKREDSFYKEKLFAQSHSVCERIGLKLIFPEHYFW
jgi:hypothetical protein